MAKGLPEVIQLGGFKFVRVPSTVGSRLGNEWKVPGAYGTLRLLKERKGWVARGEVLPGEDQWESGDAHPTPREALLAHLHLQLRKDQESFSKRHRALAELLMQVAKGEEQ